MPKNIFDVPNQFTIFEAFSGHKILMQGPIFVHLGLNEKSIEY